MASPSRSGSVASSSTEAFFSAFEIAVDVLFVALDQPVLHREVVLGIDCAFLRHQVAHVPVGGQHFVVLAQVLLDRARLGGRFDDDEMVGHA